MSNRLRTLLQGWIFLLLLFLAPAARADDFPPSPNPPRLVNDLAHLMSPDEVARLEEKVRRFSDSTSNQISIVTITSIGNYEVADYATQLGNKWGIGTKAHKNGVVIFVAKDERKMNISVGRGLEGALPDITAGQIIDQEIKPAFRENDFYRGLDRAVNAVMAATRGEYKAAPKRDSAGGMGSGLIVLIILVVVIIAVTRGGGGRGRGGGNYMSRSGAGDLATGFFLSSLLNGGFGGGRSSGGGFGGGSSDSGFGGFGGGSFGGGGASGSW